MTQFEKDQIANRLAPLLCFIGRNNKVIKQLGFYPVIFTKKGKNKYRINIVTPTLPSTVYISHLGVIFPFYDILIKVSNNRIQSELKLGDTLTLIVKRGSIICN